MKLLLILATFYCLTPTEDGKYCNKEIQPILGTVYNQWELISYVGNPNRDTGPGRFDNIYDTQPFKMGDSIQTIPGTYETLVPYYLTGWLGYESLDIAGNNNGIINNTFAEGRRTSMDFFVLDTPIDMNFIELIFFALICIILFYLIIFKKNKYEINCKNKRTI
jgi:hypothetical protein